MSYKLQREDGNLVRKFRLVEHNKPTCDAELWYHGFRSTAEACDPRLNDDNFICWYLVNGKWEILVAGREAYNRYAE